MTNFKIRVAIKQSRLKQYEIAAFLGVSEYTFSRWFRNEMPDELKNKILDAIDVLKAR